MRVAVFSDVHGNLTALEAVLADIARQAVDHIVFAGDLCLVGPRPAAALQRVRQTGMPAVYGNTEDWILGRQTPPEPLEPLCTWTLAQFSEDERAWLASLPFAHRISPTAVDANATSPDDDLLIVHANPQDVNQLIFPPEGVQMAQYGRIRQPDAALEDLMAGTEAAVMAYGHLHIPSIRPWGEKLLVNISSVSLPGDGNPQAKYGLFVWENGRWSVSHHQVSYDYQAETAAYEAAQPPGWQRIVPVMKEQNMYPQSV